MNEFALHLLALQVGLPLGLVLLHALVPASSPLGLSLGPTCWFTLDGRFLRRNDVLRVPG